ncbi:hypothetical protein GJ496_011157 [Pomphorhynchus laevis]|nr:hypothetical protein GJ496_011157 [Pomphorhynchus laevis]
MSDYSDSSVDHAEDCPDFTDSKETPEDDVQSIDNLDAELATPLRRQLTFEEVTSAGISDNEESTRSPHSHVDILNLIPLTRAKALLKLGAGEDINVSKQAVQVAVKATELFLSKLCSNITQKLETSKTITIRPNDILNCSDKDEIFVFLTGCFNEAGDK